MGKNKHVDLFKDMMPSVNMGIRELWDASPEEGQKEIKSDLWILNRWVSNVNTSDREIQEHYLLTVNEYYNKNWNDISKHPKLQWQTLCAVSHESKSKQRHEWIPLKREKNKKEEFLLNLFPNMKGSDVSTLAAITTDAEIKEYCKSLGWDKKEINGIKLSS
jgi:hypothetical protein